MSGDNKIFLMATNIAKEAIELDNQKKYDQAMDKYIQAAEALKDFAKFCKNTQLKTLAEDKAKQYVKRASQLNDLLSHRQKVKVGGPGQGKEPGKDKDGAGKGGPEEANMTDEEKELRKAIDGTIITERPTTTWEDIAGMEDAKQAIREAVVLPLLHPELFKGARKPWRGIMLYGPPGTGKTMLAKAAANECKVQFFAADSASLVSKWLGESEKLLKTLFQVAGLDAPSLIFFDEIDSLTTKRGSGNEGGGERRLKTQLLQEMQGMKSTSDKLITIMAATNVPWEIDSAVLRRFEKKIFIGPPTADGRSKIFDLCTKGVDKDSSIDFKSLGELTKNYTGSDIATVCREVVMMPVRELDISGQLVDSNQEIKIRQLTQDDFLKVISKVKPVVSEEEYKKFVNWQKEFGG